MSEEKPAPDPGDGATSTSTAHDSDAPGGDPAETDAADVRGSDDGRPNVAWAISALVGAAVPFLIMCLDRNWRWSVAVGGIGCLAAVAGVFGATGTFSDPDDAVSKTTPFAEVRGPLLELIGATIVLVAVLILAVMGSLPLPRLSAGILVPASFLWVVVSVFRAGRALGTWREDDDGVDRDLLKRHGFWLIALTTLLYLPMLGSYSLSDPWETHYGEVAREMLARDDWISLWWAQDGWFWSKPILNFWIQGIAFSLLGVKHAPDQMLMGVTQGHLPQPEWAARMPIFLLTLVAMYLLYKGCSKAFGRRAAFLGGIVLMTMPYWFFISHQSMTDMPYVAPLTASIGLFILGFSTDPERLCKVYEVDLGFTKLKLSGFHLVFGLISIAVLPQILYLLSRNLTLQIAATPHGFRPHWDEFWSGSGGRNCGLPGNQACRQTILPFAPPWTTEPGKAFQPFIAGIFWTVIAGITLWLNRKERRLQRLFFIGAWFFVALSVMGKGAPGLVIPIFVVGVFVGATRRWKDLTRLEILTGLLVILCVALPWYVQMFVRHGQPFTDRLLFHDMYKRAFVHVHDTNVGDDTSFRYYIWQLGYGLFPWTGIAAGGLVWQLRKRDAGGGLSGEVSAMLILWFVSAFAMFTISLTKFHHYIFPVVPPTAMLIGVLLHRAIGDKPLADRGYLPAYLVGACTGVTLLVYGVFRMFPGSVLGALVDGQPMSASPAVGAVAIALGVFVSLASMFLFGGRPPAAPGLDTDEGRASAYESWMIGIIGVAGAGVVGLAGRDLWTTNKGDIDGQARLMHLFTYNYRRPWPREALDFNAILLAFSILAVIVCIAMAVKVWRHHVVTALVSLAVVWTAWGVNVYLVQCSPHWGQRETMLAYYENRASPEEWLVAYQMNWKGENFYAGNRVPAFVSSGEKFKNWVEEQQKQGKRVLFFATEHGRIGSLKNELGNPKNFQVLTDKVLNNKFFIARVELDDAIEKTNKTNDPARGQKKR